MVRGINDFSMDLFSLKGKVAIVTGANQGLGMGYAVALAKAGADIFIPHFTDDIAEIKRLIEEAGRKVAFLKGDLTNDDYRNEVVKKCMDEFGRIDILLNNAGMGHFCEFTEYPDAMYAKVIDLNLNAMYYLSKRVSDIMIKQKSGKIINIGSALSFTADSTCPPYPISKHGVIGITRVFANELGKYNIQTNCITPGFYKTEVNIAISANKEFYNKIEARIPHGRWGEASDLQGTAVFLASAASDYINGWAVNVDGGFTCTL